MKYLKGTARIWAFAALIIGIGLVWVMLIILAIYFMGGGRP